MAELTATPIVALDVATRAAALAMIDQLGETCGFYKIGSELFTAEGPGIVREVRARGKDVFLDLKFHDIPNTVRAAVSSAAALDVRLVTVHASGGRAMLEAAVEGTASAAQRDGLGCRVLAVSVLTSLDASALAEAWGRERVEVEPEVLRLARVAATAGIGGLVCSAHEAAAVTGSLGRALELLVPGIRLGGGATHDQARVATPAAAVGAGARYLVLGRAVTGAPAPRAAMERVVAEIRAATRTLSSPR